MRSWWRSEGEARRFAPIRAVLAAPGPRVESALNIAGFLAALGGLLVMLARLPRAGEVFDFTYIWSAGRLWRAGLDPYATSYKALSAQFLPGQVGAPELWVYPPQWFPIASAFSLLPYYAAEALWLALNAVALAAGTMLLWRAANDRTKGLPFWLAGVTLALVLSSDPAKLAMLLGQTSALMMLGFALLAFGQAHARSGAMTAGLVLLMLKPQFGLFFLLAAPAVPSMRRPAMMAMLVSGAMCLPLLARFDVPQLILSAQNLLANLGAYGENGWNQPVRSTGPVYLFWLLGWPDPSPVLLLLISSLLSMALFRLGSGSKREGAEPAPELFWLATLGPLFAIMPLHAYDFVLFPALLLILPRLGLPSATAGVIAVFLAWRAFAHSAAIVAGAQRFGGTLFQSAEAWMAQCGVLTFAAFILLAMAAGHVHAQRGTNSRARRAPPEPAIPGSRREPGQRSSRQNRTARAAASAAAPRAARPCTAGRDRES